MITLGPDRELDGVLDAPGAFSWWYVDTVDASGNGLVCIWSWGLPFLPGYGAAAREGRAPTPRSRPSLNVATYERGRCTFYLLQELRPDEAAHQGAGTPEQSWTFGRSRFASTLHGGRRTVGIDLDVPVPGSHARVRGEVHLEGVAPELPPCGEATHLWTPLCMPARAHASLAADDGSWRFTLQGRGYHDRNQSLVPLHALGIRAWTWGRVAQPDAELVHYLVQPESMGPSTTFVLRVGADGRVEATPGASVVEHARARHPYGPRWAPAVEVRNGPHGTAALRADAPVDAGPFYLRVPLRDPATGGTGWGEHVVPGAVDIGWQRPFVRMRVHGPDADSVWLPLFSGPRNGRIARLLTQRSATRAAIPAPAEGA
jgi:hypothetical protein